MRMLGAVTISAVVLCLTHNVTFLHKICVIFFFLIVDKIVCLLQQKSPCMQLLMVKATYTLVIRAHHYRNSEHKLSNGFCCELNRQTSCDPFFCFSLCQCDNFFRFCLRRSGTSPDDNSGNCPLGSYRTRVLGDDDFSFSTSASGVMTFHGDVWPVSRCRIFVSITTLHDCVSWASRSQHTMHNCHIGF